MSSNSRTSIVFQTEFNTPLPTVQNQNINDFCKTLYEEHPKSVASGPCRPEVTSPLDSQNFLLFRFSDEISPFWVTDIYWLGRKFHICMKNQNFVDFKPQNIIWLVSVLLQAWIQSSNVITWKITAADFVPTVKMGSKNSDKMPCQNFTWGWRFCH